MPFGIGRESRSDSSKRESTVKHIHIPTATSKTSCNAPPLSTTENLEP